MEMERGTRRDEDRFAGEVTRALRRLLGARVVRRPDFALDVYPLGSSTSWRLSLATLHREATRLPSGERAEWLRQTVIAMGVTSIPTTWDGSADRLWPAVRSVSWAAVGGDGFLRRSLLPFVDLAFVVRDEGTLAFVTHDLAESWGVTETEVAQRALANLIKTPYEGGLMGGCLISFAPSASSWLAAPAGLALIAARIGTEVVAVASERDRLILVETAPDGVICQVLEAEHEDYLVAPRQVSPVPYLVRPEGLSVWSPPEGHPAVPLVRRAEYALAKLEYRHQKAKLDELNQKTGSHIVVAQYWVHGSVGEQVSMTTLNRQVAEGLLPKVDCVALIDTEDPDTAFVVRWTDIQTLAADTLTPTRYDPPLWRHAGWPDDSVVARLRDAAG